MSTGAGLLTPGLFTTGAGLLTTGAGGLKLIVNGEFMVTMPRAAKYIVRTGAFNPYGNIALTSAVDAPKWFSKPGLVVPDVYKDRV